MNTRLEVPPPPTVGAGVDFIYTVLHKLFLRSVGDVSIRGSPTLAFTHLSACTTCQLLLDSRVNESGTLGGAESGGVVCRAGSEEAGTYCMQQGVKS